MAEFTGYKPHFFNNVLSDLSLKNRDFRYAGVLLVVLFGVAAVLPGTGFVIVTLGIALLNWISGKRNFEKNYILFLLLVLFSNAFTGSLFGIEFNSLQMASSFSISANALAGLMWLQVFSRGTKIKKFRWTAIESILIVYSLWVLFTSFIAYDFSLALIELQRLPAFISIYIFTRIFLSKPVNWNSFIHVCYVSFIAISIFAAYKLAIGERFGTLGKFMFFIAPIVYLNFQKSSTFLKPRSVILLFASLTLLVAESRRILLSIGLIWLFSLVKNMQTLFLIVPVLLLGQFFIQQIDSQGGGRYTSTFEQLGEIGSGLSAEEADRLSTGRYDLWIAAFGIIKDYPIAGVGPGNIDELMPMYGDVMGQRAHNVILDVAGQLGLIGLIIFLILNILAFKKLKKLSRLGKITGEKGFSDLVKGIALALAVVLISALFGGGILFEKWGWIYYAVVAAVVSEYQIHNRKVI